MLAKPLTLQYEHQPGDPNTIRGVTLVVSGLTDSQLAAQLGTTVAPAGPTDVINSQLATHGYGPL